MGLLRIAGWLLSVAKPRPWQLVVSPLKDVWVASSLGPCE